MTHRRTTPSGSSPELPRNARKAVPLAIAALLLAGSAGLVASGAPGVPPTTLWQIGTFEGGTAGGARSEFPSTGGFVDSFTYAASGFDASPAFPGTLHNTGTASGVLRSRVVNVDFTTPCAAADATLTYARAGLETNRVEIDGAFVAEFNSTEGLVRTFTFDLGTLAAGDHRLVITYVPGPGHAGHVVDALKLDLATCDVGLDIKPGSDTNPVNPGSRGKIPVAVLSHAGFDAVADVDVASLTFGATGDEESLVACSAEGEDVNGDGLLDLVCRFDTQAAGFGSGDAEGVLEGRTTGGVAFSGTDSVTIVGNA